MKQDWWEKFFENNFAELFLKRDQKTLKRTASFLIKELHLKKNMVIFDQCCGLGYIALALVKEGMRVIGVDSSLAYIKSAKKMCKKENLPCEFFQGDAFTFLPSVKCDAAINWYTSFGYTKNDKKNIEMLECVYESLKKGGYFALDYYNFPFITKNFEPVRRVQKVINGRQFETTIFSKIDLGKGTLTSDWEYKNPNGVIKKFGGATRTYLPYDFKIMLAHVGFKNIKFYGDVGGSKLTLDSQRCIVVARKPK